MLNNMTLLNVTVGYSIIYNKSDNTEIIFNNFPLFSYLFINAFLIICLKSR